MGRSVETVSDATATAYAEFKLEPFECWECHGTGTVEEDAYTCENCRGDGTIPNYDEEGIEWRAYLEWVSETACELWPSMHDDERFLPYPHRETIIVASNAHSSVAVSEYCGVVAISLIPDYDRATFWRTDDPLGEHWRKTQAEKFLSTFGEYDKIGTFSDGTSAYRTTA